MNILENIKYNLSESNNFRENSLYKNIKYNESENKLYIELNNDKIKKKDDYRFIIIYDEYDIIIYDYDEYYSEDKIESFSINYIQFEKDRNDMILSDIIDNFFLSYHFYLR